MLKINSFNISCWNIQGLWSAARQRLRRNTGVVQSRTKTIHHSNKKRSIPHMYKTEQKNCELGNIYIYPCAAYTESAYYNEEFFNTLHTEICHFQARGNVLLCGDFNARTGTEPDYRPPRKRSCTVFGNTPLYLTPTTTK